MNTEECSARLLQQGRAIVAAFRAVPQAEIRWKPAPGKWSIIEVLGHLVDEEMGDFRVRIASTLAGPEDWDPIDPEGWVRERDHQGADVEELLGRFGRERDQSVTWLDRLGECDWEATYQHPEIGRVTAGDLMASWMAHDLLHLRQVVGIRLAALQDAAAPWSTEYAGPS